MVNPTEINPISYGMLIAKVEMLEHKIDSMESDLKELLALANKGRGGFWMGMMIASLIGAVVSWGISAIGHIK